LQNKFYLKVKYLHIYADEIKTTILLLVIYIENKPSADNAQRSGGKYITEVRHLSLSLHRASA